MGNFASNQSSQNEGNMLTVMRYRKTYKKKKNPIMLIYIYAFILLFKDAILDVRI